MIWLRWTMIVFAAATGATAVYFMYHGDYTVGLLMCVCAGMCWPDTLIGPWLTSRSSAGRAYGVSYYLEFDGVAHYFKANVYGHKVTASHERAIKAVIFRQLTQAISCRAVDKVIGRLK